MLLQTPLSHYTRGFILKREEEVFVSQRAVRSEMEWRGGSYPALAPRLLKAGVLTNSPDTSSCQRHTNGSKRSSAD